MPTTDFTIYHDGSSIVLLTPHTSDAFEWCDLNLPQDAPRLGCAYAVEARYFRDIAEGLQQDGFTIS